jgi:hypothetical protein
MKIIKVEDWEQNHINGLTLDLILYATIATLVATLIAFLAHKTDMPEIKELLFAPWSVALVVGTKPCMSSPRKRGPSAAVRPLHESFSAGKSLTIKIALKLPSARFFNLFS